MVIIRSVDPIVAVEHVSGGFMGGYGLTVGAVQVRVHWGLWATIIRGRVVRIHHDELV